MRPVSIGENSSLQPAAPRDIDMNKNIVMRGLMGLLVATTAVAVVGCGEEDGKTANVANAAPVAREVCRDEIVTLTREPKDKKQIGGTAVGAVIGGVLGNQIGGGDGKKIATVGGAVAGGYAGNKIQENMQENNTYQETRRVCEMVYDK
jgi:uncharacterized protein YcfJ